MCVYIFTHIYINLHLNFANIGTAFYSDGKEKRWRSTLFSQKNYPHPNPLGIFGTRSRWVLFLKKYDIIITLNNTS